MKVQDLMTKDVKTCAREAELVAVARMMASGEWGVIPVVESHGKVLGVITDHDISLALAEHPKTACEVKVEELLSGTVHCCCVTDDIRDALETMQERGLPCLPVVDESGRLAGTLTLDDLALAAKPLQAVGRTDVSYADVAATMKAVSGESRRRPRDGRSRGQA